MAEEAGLIEAFPGTRMPSSTILLTNFVAPYRLPLFKKLQEALPNFRIYVSTSMERGRAWEVDHAGLNISIHKNLTFRRKWKHPGGFTEILNLHVPWDTFPVLRRSQPELVISAEMGFRSLFAALYRSTHRRSRLILWATTSERTEQGRSVVRRLVRRWLFSRADGVIVNGESGARYVRSFAVEDRKIFRVPQSADISGERGASPAPLDDNRKSRRLLFVGQLTERKGLAQFLESICRWSQANGGNQVELWIAGDGPLRSSLQAREFPANVAVRWFGNLSYQEISELYLQAGILVFPTLADEWGMVVGEAMQAGLPVLGSVYSQAVEDLVEEGVNGWTFYPNIPESIDHALQRSLSATPEILSSMRRAAHLRGRELAPEQVALKMLAAIGTVCE